MSNSVRPQRRQPTRLPRPWDSPGKNTGVGCHFLLQCMKVKTEREVAQSCLTPSDPMDCSLPGSSVHGICQPRVMEWGATAFSPRHHYPPTKFWAALHGCTGELRTLFLRKMKGFLKVPLVPMSLVLSPLGLVIYLGQWVHG